MEHPLSPHRFNRGGGTLISGATFISSPLQWWVLPDELRNIIEGGPPEGILSRFNDMFDEKEKATHIKAAEVMRELGWNATD